MRRREFFNFVGGAALAWPLPSRAQDSSKAVVGILGSVAPGPYQPFMAAIKEGLKASGFVEGQNLSIEYRWAEGQYGRLPALAAELVSRRVGVIVLVGGGPAVPAAKAATTTIPIVFTMGDDPVKTGLVEALNRPGGNITGISLLTVSMEAKRLQLLHELVPHVVSIASLVNPNNPQVPGQLHDLHAAARTMGVKLLELTASSAVEIDSAFVRLAREGAGALIIAVDAFFNTERDRMIALSTRHAVPAIYGYREFPAAGGLVSYGPSLADGYRQAGIYAGRILKGEKPADLPIQQAVKVELVINLKTAKTLGVTVPLSLLGRADEVIE